MLALQRHSAVFLLAVFAVGGLLAPSLHRLHHAEEEARERAEHVQDGHHHHGEDHTHDAQLDVPCADRVVGELSCALCAGLSALVALARPAVLPSLPGERPAAAYEGRAAEVAARGYSNRGPPVA